MRMFLIKLLLKLLGYYDLRVAKSNSTKIKDFLASLASDSIGYKDYYTERKRHILMTLSHGLEPKEYWMNLGRLSELQFANFMSVKVLKSDKKELDLDDTKENIL